MPSKRKSSRTVRTDARSRLKQAPPRRAPAGSAVQTAASNAIAVRLREQVREAAIERAKLEWESTVDALAALVCLLGRDGQVLRANRVVEDWSLGGVGRVSGTTAHALLHKGCKRVGCALAGFIEHALSQIRSGLRGSFELEESIGERDLTLTIMPMRLQPGTSTELGEPLAVLIANDVTALHRTQDALERLNTDLEARVRSRTQALADANRDLRNEIHRREQAEMQLRTSRDELAALSAQLIGAQEGERKRISQELHDSVGQSMSAVKYTLERAVKLLQQPRGGNVAAVLQSAVKRIQETAENIRAISMNLRPAILDDLGAASAVQWLCRDFGDVYPSITVTVDIAVGDRDVPDQLATVVFRCVQELLNNVAKHAAARGVWVRLAVEGDELQLLVRDDGVGLDTTIVRQPIGAGLRNLRERAQITRGQFKVEGVQGKGTTACLKWPLLNADPTERAANSPDPVGKRGKG